MRDGSARRQVMNGQPRTWTSERAPRSNTSSTTIAMTFLQGTRGRCPQCAKWTRREVTTLLDDSTSRTILIDSSGPSPA